MLDITDHGCLNEPNFQHSIDSGRLCLCLYRNCCLVKINHMLVTLQFSRHLDSMKESDGSVAEMSLVHTGANLVEFLLVAH